MSTGDWNELYALAAERYPDIYMALVEIDRAVRDLVVAGVLLDDERVVAAMQDHDHLTGALRILQRGAGVHA